MLYDPFIERDAVGMRKVMRDFRAEHSAEELFVAVARFAVLAYSPSLHGKRALLCCLAAHDLREELGDRFDDVVMACGVYAAMARQPWSEPPILDPPTVEATAGADDELVRAIETGDRLRGERWLAARLDDPHLARSYFARAAGHLAEDGDAMMIAAAAWRLAPILGEKGRFSILRLGVWEMIAAGGEEYVEHGRRIDAPPLLERLIDAAVAGHGSPLALQPLFLLNAADEAASVAGEPLQHRVLDYLTAKLEREREAPHAGASPRREGELVRPVHPEVPLYPLGRDYGCCLIAHAVARGFHERYPGLDFEPLLAAAHENLASGESFEEWS